MTGDTTEQIQDLLDTLDSADLDEHMTAIRILAEIGDEEALRAHRQRLPLVNRELAALITAVGKLKRRLGVK